MIIENGASNDHYTYEITGYGDEPLAEDHIILNCRARKRT